MLELNVLLLFEWKRQIVEKFEGVQALMGCINSMK